MVLSGPDTARDSLEYFARVSSKKNTSYIMIDLYIFVNISGSKNMIVYDKMFIVLIGILLKTITSSKIFVQDLAIFIQGLVNINCFLEVAPQIKITRR